MAAVSPKTATPPSSHEAFATFSQDISRAIMTATSPKSAKLQQMPPAPPPSPVAFAIDSNGKTTRGKHEKVPSLSLE
ncbi:hypothetical protein N7495_006153 [Penicillium taxi]|uniref:uncharacterized protein n=1 Tax=Penicillium taxi TaxID=168475 RepID=UPI00254556D7|nr:uncharacterized protein N7495_006153 [Penicillium taxi]KAJ5894462.1 hypothetical protein N7495_006153 [Penicillium taxi]